MINFNGTLFSNNTAIFTEENRAFRYGDAIFETIKMVDAKCIFLEDHYFRLLASMRMLRMEIPMHFTHKFLQEEIEKTTNANEIEDARIRFSVSRKAGGRYTPNTHEIDYVIECSALDSKVIDDYVVDVYKDYFVSTGFLSTVKSNNRMINVLASIYASENQLNNCILLNDNKHVAEAINGNVFIVVGNTVKTPALDQGCINGIIRKKIVEIVNADAELELEEAAISPFELLKADELFITNAIVGIQSVSAYKKSIFSKEVGQQLASKLEALV